MSLGVIVNTPVALMAGVQAITQSPTAVVNEVLRRHGLNVTSPSSQLHIRQQEAHTMANSDLKKLSTFSQELLSPEVNCDFSHLGSALWQNLHDLRTTVTQTGSTDAAKTDASVSSVSLTSRLIRVARAATVLATLEGPLSSKAVKDAILVSQDDILGVTQLMRALPQVVGISATSNGIAISTSTAAAAAAAQARNPSVSKSATQKMAKKTEQELEFNLLSAFELCTVSLWDLLASLCHRPLDISCIVEFFQDDLQWKLSGISILCTRCYCNSICTVISYLLEPESMQAYTDALRVAAVLSLHYLAKRPFFNWNTYQRTLSYSLQTKRGAVTPASAMLLMMTTVCHSMTRLLIAPHTMLPKRPKNAAAAAQNGSGDVVVRLFTQNIPALRREIMIEVHETLEKAETGRALLSYTQLAVLAAVEGLPGVDLTDTDGLMRRAIDTHLCEGVYMNPAFLRILMSTCYIIPTPQHVPLSPASAVSLIAAISSVILQVPLFGSSATDSTHTLLNLSVDRIPVSHLLRIAVSAVSDRQSYLVVDDNGVDDNHVHAAMECVCSSVEAVYSANVRAASSKVVPSYTAALRGASLNLVNAFSVFFAETDPARVMQNDNLSSTVCALAKLYAVQFNYPPPSDASRTVQLGMERTLRTMEQRLAYVTSRMSVREVSSFMCDVLIPAVSEKTLNRRNRMEYAYAQGLYKAVGTKSVASALPIEIIVHHWCDVALSGITNTLSGGLSIAAYDFFTAVFTAHRFIAPLFVPTLVELFAPVRGPNADESSGSRVTSRYGAVPLFLMSRFAKTIRAVCQGLERCDAAALDDALSAENSPLMKAITSANRGVAPELSHLNPLSSILLIVSAVFDRVTADLRLMALQGSRSIVLQTNRVEEVKLMYCALANLLQCDDPRVVERVWSSVRVVFDLAPPSLRNPLFTYTEKTIESMQNAPKQQVVVWLLEYKKQHRWAAALHNEK